MKAAARKYAQKKAKQIERQNAPRWSGLLTVVLAVGFIGYAGWGLISGDDAQPPTDDRLIAAPPPEAADGTDERPTPDPSPSTPTVDPDSTDEPKGTAPQPVVDDGATVELPGPSGTTVTVPKAARAVAITSFTAFFDADAAAKVPTVDGNPLPAPAAPDPAGQVSKVRLAAPPTPSVLQFAAEVDLDGTGPQEPVTYYRTVMLTGDGWAVTRVSG